MQSIRVRRLTSATHDARALIDELDGTLALEYAPEQRHGLTLDAIFQPHIRFFIADLDGTPAGCGGVAFAAGFAEVKRMYVREPARGRGVADALLAQIERETRANGCDVLRLETGSRQAAALRFYERSGFHPCAAFGDYVTLDPQAVATSIFLEKQLRVTNGE